MFGEFVYNCIKLKVWAQASMTLVFFYSIHKNGTSEAYAVASHKSQAVIKGSPYESNVKRASADPRS